MKTVKPIFFIIILICSLIFAAVGGALLFYAMNFCYDAEIQHFVSKAPAVIGFSAVFVASAVLSVATYFTAGKHTVFNKKEGFSFPGTFLSVLSACFCIYFGYMTFKNGLAEGKEFITLFQIAFSFLSALWFLLDAFGLTNKSGSVKLLSAAPALMATFITSYLYFTPNYAMNASIKGTCVLMSIAFMLHFIEYCGVVLEAPFSARKYAAATVLSTVIGGSVSLALLGSVIFNFSGFNYTMLTCCMFVVLWLLSVFTFAEYAAGAKTVLPEEKTEEEETAKNEEESEEVIENDTEDAPENKTEENGEEDSDELYGDDEDDDIYLPPVEFDDEDVSEKE
ncbi:MAG: hypothetical protein E7660_07005 [Ruminococcaceae bacterium]|nr:hypothetical protein [Oscillospiraceae bacterium]